MKIAKSSPQMPNDFLPYGKQTIDEDDIKAVADVLRGDFLTTGPAVDAFEKALCEYIGVKHCIVVGNGTHALHLACLAAKLGPGQHAIVPSITFLATANAVRYCGADVIFCDVDPHSGLMRPDDLTKALNSNKDKKITAVLPVHMGGQSADMDALHGIAKAHNLKIIADACHALSGQYKNTRVGDCQFEDMATFSFHPVKPITTGEGGAITTNNDALAQRMRILRTHGLDRRNQPHAWAYEMQEVGYNYRLTDMQCALGLSQLKKLDDFTQKRRHLATLYNEQLKPLAPLILPPAVAEQDDCAWHLYAARFDFKAIGKTRDQVVAALKDMNIGTQVHYIPVHTQPYYKALYGPQNLPGADAYYEGTLSLPLFPGMEERDVERVIRGIKQTIGH